MLNHSFRYRLTLLRKDKPLALLLFVGAVLAVWYVHYSEQVFDDLSLPSQFASLVREHGYFQAGLTLLMGGDLPFEYRTYGLSRSLQFIIWCLVGARSQPYSLFIALSQAGSAVLLLLLARQRGLSSATSLAIALIWEISPFSATWTFHHYSYLILPFQILMLAIYLTPKLQNPRSRLLIAVAFGVVLALTGESHLVSVFLVMAYVGMASNSAVTRSYTLATSVTICVTLAIHRGVWIFFLQDRSHTARFALTGNGGYQLLMSRLSSTLLAIWNSATQQSVEIWSGGTIAGLIAGIVIAILYWLAVSSRSQRNTDDQARQSRLQDGVVVLHGVILASAASVVYILLSVGTGQVSIVTPRRYLFVPLTLFTMSSVVFVGHLFGSFSAAYKSAHRLGCTVAIALVSILASQFYLIEIPASRASDKQIVARMTKAASQNAAGSSGGVLYFVASENQCPKQAKMMYRWGPKSVSSIKGELFESPFASYWTARNLALNSLGFRFSAEPSLSQPVGAIVLDDSTASIPGPISPDETIVVSNLGFDPADEASAAIRVFNNFRDFDPSFFGRRIDRDIFQMKTSLEDDYVIDLGQKGRATLSDASVGLDKDFSDPILNKPKWIENYGLLQGGDGVYIHPDISNALSTYKSNRFGAFTYGVTFAQSTSVEVSLDFWEQWGRKPGERRFAVEVSWDDMPWVNVGIVDPAKLNGTNPFALVLTRGNAKRFTFRLVPSLDTQDVPFVQNIRLRNLQAAASCLGRPL